MAVIAKSVVDVVLGEATHGTPEERFNDMVAIMSVIANRSAALGVPPEKVVSVKSEFNAYSKALPPGSQHFRSMAQKAVDHVNQNGPVHNAMFFATPTAAGRLPRGLEAVTQTTGHNYFMDPQGRSIKTAEGYKMPNAQPVSIPNAPVPQAAPRAAAPFDNARLDNTAPVPTGPLTPQALFDAQINAQVNNRFATPTPISASPAFQAQPAPAPMAASPVSSYLMSAPEVTRGSQRINNEAKSLQHPQAPGSVRDAQVYANQQNAKQPTKSMVAPPSFRSSAKDQVAPSAPPSFRSSAQDQVASPAKSLQHPQTPGSIRDAMVYANNSPSRMAADPNAAITAASKTSRTGAPTNQVASNGPVSVPATGSLADAYNQRAASLQAMGQLNLSGNKTASMDLNTGMKSEPVFAPDGGIYAPAGSTAREAAAYAQKQATPAPNAKAQVPAYEMPSKAAVASQPAPRGASGADVWSGKAKTGTATDGSTISAMPDGKIGRYSNKYDHTEFTNPDGSYGGLKAGNQLSAYAESARNPNANSKPANAPNANGDNINPFSGAAIPAPQSKASKALEAMFNPTSIGKTIGAIAGGLLAGPGGATIGGSLGGKASAAVTKDKPRDSLMKVLMAPAQKFPSAPQSFPAAPTPSGKSQSENLNKSILDASAQARGAINSGKQGLY